MARYGVNVATHRWFRNDPQHATAIVNIVGCLVIILCDAFDVIRFALDLKEFHNSFNLVILYKRTVNA